MLASITCTSCQRKFTIPEGEMGQRHTCSSCHSSFLAGKTLGQGEVPMKLQRSSAAAINKTMLGEIEPPINYNCPRCKTDLTAPSIEVGTKKPCPSCGQRVQVPAVGKAANFQASTPVSQGASAAAPQGRSSRPPPMQAGGETSSAVRPSKNWMIAAGIGAAVLLIGTIGVLILRNRQPDKKLHEEPHFGGVAGLKDDDQKKKSGVQDGDKENPREAAGDGVEPELVEQDIKYDLKDLESYGVKFKAAKIQQKQTEALVTISLQFSAEAKNFKAALPALRTLVAGQPIVSGGRQLELRCYFFDEDGVVLANQPPGKLEGELTGRERDVFRIAQSVSVDVLAKTKKISFRVIAPNPDEEPPQKKKKK